ncbi:MAG: putative Histidine kinase [Candidatus Saccharibacteria bacterium]|nr:putative Histidine kinase [Candidatus Saccharibacteria bacterium]
MAIDKPPQLVKDYWPQYRRRSLFFVVCMQIIATLVIVIALMLAEVVEPTNSIFWIIMTAIGATAVGINILVFSVLTEPLQMLSHALAHAAGESTITTPPNPNTRRYEKSGFKPLLQTIYELGGSQPNAPSESHTKGDLAFETILGTSSTGIVFLKEGNVIYANKSAPIHTDKDGSLQLDIITDVDQTIDEWIAECDEHAVNATKTWRRVANKLVGEDERKIYDMTASYQKGSEVEVVLALVERTDEYLPEDNDLDFISFAAHELRGPITVIRGYLDTLGDELSDRFANDEQELFNRLVVSANRLSSYVNNILNAAKYDRRHLTVHLHEESMGIMYDAIKDDMQLRAIAQNRLLAVSLPSDLPTVAADRSAIGEVMGNLIDNAIKYSNDGGSVSVSAQVVQNSVEVSVADQGIGMPSNVVSNLFHKFYRSHRSRETVAGTGIGLYICKAIVESHGGTISVKSVEGEGSTFSFTLPIYATVAEKLKAGDNTTEGLIRHHDGWIKNHGSMRG